MASQLDSHKLPGVLEDAKALTRGISRNCPLMFSSHTRTRTLTLSPFYWTCWTFTSKLPPVFRCQFGELSSLFIPEDFAVLSFNCTILTLTLLSCPFQMINNPAPVFLWALLQHEFIKLYTIAKTLLWLRLSFHGFCWWLRTWVVRLRLKWVWGRFPTWSEGFFMPLCSFTFSACLLFISLEWSCSFLYGLPSGRRYTQSTAIDCITDTSAWELSYHALGKD